MKYRAKILSIRAEYLSGKISYETAQARVLPLLVEMNRKGEAIAKRHGRKFTKLTFGYIFR